MVAVEVVVGGSRPGEPTAAGRSSWACPGSAPSASGSVARMRVIARIDADTSPREGSVVTIGAYDGVHLGHQAVIAEVRREAAARGCASAVVTFDRHPATVVRPESAPRLLCDLDQKLELLEATGIDLVAIVAFHEAPSPH